MAHGTAIILFQDPEAGFISRSTIEICQPAGRTIGWAPSNWQIAVSEAISTETAPAKLVEGSLRGFVSQFQMQNGQTKLESIGWAPSNWQVAGTRRSTETAPEPSVARCRRPQCQPFRNAEGGGGERAAGHMAIYRLGLAPTRKLPIPAIQRSGNQRHLVLRQTTGLLGGGRDRCVIKKKARKMEGARAAPYGYTRVVGGTISRRRLHKRPSMLE